MKLNKAIFLIRNGKNSDIPAITECSSKAFLADGFFKKPEYRIRFQADNVKSMISIDKSLLFVAEIVSNTMTRDSNTNGQAITTNEEHSPNVGISDNSNSLCGSIYLQYKYENVDSITNEKRIQVRHECVGSVKWGHETLWNGCVKRVLHIIMR